MIAPPPLAPLPTFVVLPALLSSSPVSASPASCLRLRPRPGFPGALSPLFPCPLPRSRLGVLGVLPLPLPRPRPGVLVGVDGPRPGLPGVTTLLGRPRPRRGVMASSSIFYFVCCSLCFRLLFVRRPSLPFAASLAVAVVLVRFAFRIVLPRRHDDIIWSSWSEKFLLLLLSYLRLAFVRSVSAFGVYPMYA